MATEAHQSMPSVCNTHTFCSTFTIAGYISIVLLNRTMDAGHSDGLGQVFTIVLFTFLIFARGSES